METLRPQWYFSVEKNIDTRLIQSREQCCILPGTLILQDCIYHVHGLLIHHVEYIPDTILCTLLLLDVASWPFLRMAVSVPYYH